MIYLEKFITKGDCSSTDISKKFIDWYENGTSIIDDEERDQRKCLYEQSIDRELKSMEITKTKITKEKKIELNRRAKIAFEEFKEQHPELKGDYEKLKRTFEEMYAWEQEKQIVDYIFNHKYRSFYEMYKKHHPKTDNFSY